MTRTTIPIASGYYVDESPAISTRECVNFYTHIPESQTITDAALLGVSGCTLIADAGVNDFCRGLHEIGDRAFAVMGASLWELTKPLDFLFTDLSNAVSGSSKVFTSDNGSQMCIVAPDYVNQFNAYIYNIDTDVFAQISDVDFDGPVSCVTYSDGYFIFAKKDSNKWFISNLRDGLAYTATDFASAESDPDNIVVIAALRGIVFVFGSHTFEQYQNAPSGAGFPYQRINSGIYNKGCEAPKSVVEVNNMLVWIGSGINEQPAIWASNGGPPEKLSTASIDSILFSGGLDQIRLAWSVRWAENGHSFVAFTVPDICTVVYDFSTNLWHKRESLDRDDNLAPWRVPSMINAFSSIIVGDTYEGRIGTYSKESTYEFDKEIRGYFTTPAIDNGGKPFSVNQIQLVAQTGHVPISGQGSDPIIRMSVSKNNGLTYSPEISRKMGKIGEYEKTITWPCLGRFSRSCQLRWDISEPIQRVFVKGEIEIAS
jgi:hypothetical protein